MEGSGLYVYGNGDMYLGSFSAGKRHGQGSYHFKEMVCQLVGEWVEGGFVRGRWVMKDGSMFYGSFHKQVAPVSTKVLTTRSSVLWHLVPIAYDQEHFLFGVRTHSKRYRNSIILITVIRG